MKKHAFMQPGTKTQSKKNLNKLIFAFSHWKRIHIHRLDLNRGGELQRNSRFDHLHQPQPAEISTLAVAGVVNSYLRPQQEKLTLSLTCRCVSLWTDGQWKQTAFPFPLPVPVPPSPPPVSQDRPHLRYNICYTQEVLFLIFLAFWQRKEPQVSGVKEMLSNQRSFPFLSAPSASRRRTVAGFNEGGVGHTHTYTHTHKRCTQAEIYAYKCKNKYPETESHSRAHTQPWKVCGLRLVVSF